MDKPASDNVVGIFAKAPVPGRVKTRLTPPLSPEQAAELYRASLLDTVEAMSTEGFDLVLCYAGGHDFFQQHFPGLPLLRQRGADLGARMDAALQELLARGYQRALLIGSDSPDLPPALVEQAFAVLERQPLALAPAQDGGYVLIGEARHHPELFTDLPWSTPNLLELTCRRAAQRGIDYALLPAWDDLDDLPSLQRFLQRGGGGRTAACLRSLPELRKALAQG